VAVGSRQMAEVNKGKPWTSTEGGKEEQGNRRRGFQVPFWSPTAQKEANDGVVWWQRCSVSGDVSGGVPGGRQRRSKTEETEQRAREGEEQGKRAL